MGTHYKRWNISYKNIEIDYQGNSGDIADGF